MIINIDESTLNYYELDCYVKDIGDVQNITNDDYVIDFQIVRNYLTKFDPKPNLYFLYAFMDSKWEIIYIGQRKRGFLGQRLKEHLIKKDYRTGSKLSFIKEYLNNDVKIGLKVSAVIPDELRMYYEVKLINSNKPRLNIHK